MKPTAVLVNAARGEVVDEGALVRALSERRIAGAALDVYEQEPLPADHPLRALDNVVLTPHLGASTAEAQQNVAVEIAEGVRAALLDGDLSKAVNAPAIGREEMRRARPLLALGERLGELAAVLADDAVSAVEVRYAGAADEVLRPLAASVLAGVLARAHGKGRVNLVNALHLAEQRGIDVRQVRASAQGDYAEHIEVLLRAGAAERRVAGALLGEGHPRVVRVDDFRIDVVPRGTLVLCWNHDVPGVIGRVGTLLGAAGVNIGEYHQARLAAGGEALAAISVDGRLSAALLAALRALPEVHDVREVELGV
jgi:D-3-phosphoglycerate dehydrogenase